MYQINRFIFYFLCFRTLIQVEADSDKFLRLKSIAIRNGITSEWVGKTTSKVYINGKEYEIYIHYPLGQNVRAFDDNTFINLYTCVCCEFAKWTQNKVFKLIEYIPLLYQSSFFSPTIMFLKNISPIHQ